DEAKAKADELAGQLEIAHREITALAERLDTIGAAANSTPSERAARALHLAKIQAGEITSRAQSAADTAWAAAEDASTALRERYSRLLADLDRQHTEIHAEHQSIMDVARAKVATMTTDADRRREELDVAAEHEREQVEAQFVREIETKRAELDQEIETARTTSEAEAAHRVSVATDEAADRIATATAHVERLTALRDQVADRLRHTSDLLAQSSTLLAPLDSESEMAQDDTEPHSTSEPESSSEDDSVLEYSPTK
ncbi:MAG: hypothetical protein M3548_09800, partial [Actinomycetota bacterium]|nr:hypothetical protein [Actinomycetota bacterium]